MKTGAANRNAVPANIATSANDMTNLPIGNPSIRGTQQTMGVI